jgi:hypothetical protein
MMTLKTNRRNIYIFFLFTISLLPSAAQALSTYECLRDLMPITDRASLQNKRQNVEEPFALDEKFVIFPEVVKDAVVGFYFYGPKGAAYYDAVEKAGKVTSLAELTFKKDDGVYELVAQPNGIETVTVQYLPGFKLAPTGKDGPVMLGASVLPVFGAFVSRPDMDKSAYLNPKSVTEISVKKWMAENWQGRRPASIEELPINSTIVKLKTLQPKSNDDLWKPAKNELKLRKAWIQTHNLDERAFKQLSLAMEGSCKEP